MDTKTIYCPCNGTTVTAKRLRIRQSKFCEDSKNKYTACCGRYLDSGETAPTAEALMRSRYTAYTLDREDYLLATWHPSTRPATFEQTNQPRKQWLGLEVRRHEQSESDRAVVEFVARFKVNGRAYRLHEISRFVCEAGQWFYVDGDILSC